MLVVVPVEMAVCDARAIRGVDFQALMQGALALPIGECFSHSNMPIGCYDA
jgi:hypothetical protein